MSVIAVIALEERRNVKDNLAARQNHQFSLRNNMNRMFSVSAVGPVGLTRIRLEYQRVSQLTFICFLQIAKSKKKKNQKVKLTDIEPLPTAIILNNLKTRSKCNIDKMVSIECLTIDGRHPKDLDLDVECSLERGLVCK